MPRQKVLNRDYDIPDADLIQRSDTLKALVARDATEFATRGVADTDDLEAARATFADFPTDDELAADVNAAAAAKDAIQAEPLDLTDPIRNMAAMAFGEGSAKYKAFGFAGLVNKRDADMHRAVKRIHRRATAALSVLTPHGLSTGMLTALAAKNTQYDDAIDDVPEAEAVRDEKTEDRVDLGNKLHAEYTRLCSIGKSLWENTSESKYNDYVMDPAGNGNNQPNPDPGGGGGGGGSID